MSKSFKTYESYVVFYRGDAPNGERVYLPVLPEDFSINNQSDTSSQSVIGRGAPYIVYNGANQRSSNMSLLLRYDHEMYLTGETDITKTETYKLIKGFESSVYPTYSTVNDARGLAAPRVTIVLARSLCVSKGIVTSCQLSHQLPVITIGGRPYYSTVKIDVSINHAPDPAYTASSVYSNRSVISGDVYPN